MNEYKKWVEHDAKLEVEEQIYEHYEGERDYYNALMAKFEGREV